MKKIVLLFFLIIIFSGCTNNNKILKEYPHLKDKKHIIVEVNYTKLMTLLDEDEEMILFFGFPACPNCQAAIKYINEAAKEAGFNRVYYFDIEIIRKDADVAYQNLIEKLEFESEKLINGIPRMAVPTVLKRKNKETKGWVTREYFWNDEIDDLNPNDKEELISAYQNLFSK